MTKLASVVLENDTTITLDLGGLASLKGAMSYPFHATIINEDRNISERIQITGEVSPDIASVVRAIDNTKARKWEKFETVLVHNSLLTVGGKEVQPLSIGLTGKAATTASTGTVSVSMTHRIVTVTPSGNCTFTATGGVEGQAVTFIITTTGTVSRVLTFGTNFKPVGTLATGTVTARRFCISFIYDGTLWIEISRTAAIP